MRELLATRRIAQSARFALAISGLVGTLAGGPNAYGGSARVRPAWAQADADLSAARQLFAEGLADEQAGRQSAALEKFQRVQAVRDTQAVRYRIASCLEALGELRAALAAYTSASVAAGGDAESASIARASRDKMEAVSKRVARLVVTLSAHAPADAIVKIDGEPLQPNVVGTPIVLDPGPHEIVATGSGAVPFHAHLALPEGAQSGIEATLVVAPPPEPLPPVVEPRPRPLPRETQGPPPETPASPERTTRTGRTTAGIVLLASGGALLAGATAILLVRNADIQSIEAACAGGLCPTSQESQLESTHNRAVIEGPAGVAVGVGGIAAAGVGIYFLATNRRPPAVAIAPWIDRATEGVSLRGRF